MSDNLYNFAKEQITIHGLSTLLVIGKEKDISSCIKLFMETALESEKKTLVYYAPEIHERAVSLAKHGFDLCSSTNFKWSLKNELLEIFGRSSFNGAIEALHEGDNKRILTMRINRLLSRKPNNFLREKLGSSYGSLKFFLLFWPILLTSLILKISRIKPKYDDLLKYENKKGDIIYILRSSMHEKDHYGESPLDIWKLDQIIERCMGILRDCDNLGVFIFIGQRVRWYKSIEKSVRKLRVSHTLFFILSAWRNSHKKELYGVPGGKYISGSNKNRAYGETFSPHCVEIGALDHELWYRELVK